MEIKIKDTNYKLKYTLRALFIYEQITGKVFEMKTITDEYLFFYCLLAANNPDIQLTFDDFIECCDDDLNLVMELQKFLQNEMKKQSAFLVADPDDKKKP